MSETGSSEISPKAAGQKPRLFFSYQQRDREFTERLYRYCKQRGEYECWMAPFDIDAGSAFARDITEAIVWCDALVIVYSSETAKSRHVESEVQAAFDQNKRLIPVRTEKIDYPQNLIHYLRGFQWIDCFSKTPTELIPETEERIRQALVHPKAPIPTPVMEPPTRDEVASRSLFDRRIFAIAMMLAALVAATWMFHAWFARLPADESPLDVQHVPNGLQNQELDLFKRQQILVQAISRGQGFQERIMEYEEYSERYRTFYTSGRPNEAQRVREKLAQLSAELLALDQKRTDAKKAYQTVQQLIDNSSARRSSAFFPKAMQTLLVKLTNENANFEKGCFEQAKLGWEQIYLATVRLIEKADRFELSDLVDSVRIECEMEGAYSQSMRTRGLEQAMGLAGESLAEFDLKLTDTLQETWLDADAKDFKPGRQANSTHFVFHLPVPSQYAKSVRSALAQEKK